MAFTYPPKTWDTTLVTPTHLNTEIRDQFLSVQRVLAMLTPTVPVVSTAAETTLFTYTLPANLLSIKGALRFKIQGTLVNTTGSNQNVDLKLKSGATQIVGGSIGYSNNITANIDIECIVQNLNATNSQKAAGIITAVHTAGGSSWQGGGAFTSGVELYKAGGTLSLITSSDLTFTVTCTLGTASANLTFTAYTITVELLNP